jgi:hypothetical protein
MFLIPTTNGGITCTESFGHLFHAPPTTDRCHRPPPNGFLGFLRASGFPALALHQYKIQNRHRKRHYLIAGSIKYFHASLKLKSKQHRDGKWQRVYGEAQTPLARVLASAEVSAATKARLRQKKAERNPFALKQAVTKSLKEIEAMRRRPHH